MVVGMTTPEGAIFTNAAWEGAVPEVLSLLELKTSTCFDVVADAETGRTVPTLELLWANEQ